MSLKTYASMSMLSFSRFDGIASRAQDLTDDCKIIRLISAVIAGVNSQSCADW